MAGGDPAGFDYLFEPVDGDLEEAGDGDVQKTTSSRSLVAVAMVAAVVLGVGLGILFLAPRSADRVQSPAGVITTAPPVPVMTSSPIVDPPPPETVTTVEPTQPPVVPATESEPEPEPEPELPPSTSQAPEPRKLPTAPPSVGSPNSASPAPLPTVPTQHPGGGSTGHGGLLGIGGL